MKKINYLFLVLISFLLFIGEESYANVYASGIKISDESVVDYALAGNTWDMNFTNGGVRIWFVINEAGGGTITAQVRIKQGVTIVRTLNVASPVKGVNSVVWDGYNNSSAPAPIGTYTFEVQVSDPVGHSTFDSLWVAGAYYQGPDFDGGTSYAYRGNSSIYNQSNPKFGNIYVSRGTTSDNGFYEIRGDGVYKQKIGTAPSWPSSTPNEIAAVDGKLYGLAGYGFTGAGYAKGYDALTNTFSDSTLFGTINVRGLIIKVVGSDTIFYTCRSGSGVNPAVIKKTGINGDTSTVIDMRPLIPLPNAGYIKTLAIDDAGNMYVAYGNASASRKKLAIFNSTGTMVFNDSLDGAGGLTSGAYFHSLALYSGDPGTVLDDKMYALIYSSLPAEWGFYSGVFNGLIHITDKLYSPVEGRGTGATSQIINVDPAGNVIWSNGNAQEKIVSFSPPDGPNSFLTQNPTGYSIQVDVIVPVELVSLNASARDNIVELTWITATEINNAGFDIERRINNSWEKIGFVIGFGTSTEVHQYLFIDNSISASGNIQYRLKQIDLDGSFTFSDEVEVTLNIPQDFELSQNYPNPFNPSTKINFKLPGDSKIKLEIFSLSGELVAVLVDEIKSAGNHEVEFDAGNFASGTYIYRLTAGTVILSKKMLLIK